MALGNTNRNTTLIDFLWTCWGERYGQLKDPFGHIWSIATHKQDLSQEEIQKACETVLKEMTGSLGKG